MSSVVVAAPASDRTRPVAVPTSGRRRHRWLSRLVLAVAAAAVSWLAVTAVAAVVELRAAEGEIATLTAAARAHDITALERSAGRAARHLATAHRRTSGPLWRLAAELPWAGDSFAVLRSAASAGHRLGADALPSLVTSARALDPERVRPAGDTVDLGRLEAAAPALDRAATAAALAHAELATTATGLAPAPLKARHTELTQRVAEVADSLRSASAAVAVLPRLLGSEQPRRYLVAFQNNAEARGTGGLLGAYAIVSAEAGRVQVVRLGPNTELRSADRLPVDLGPAFAARYGNDPALWVNGNLSPHFPYAGAIWSALWERQTGQRLDGVVATDPVALSHLLRATGPVAVPGGTASADNVVALTMRDVYAMSDDNTARDAFLQHVARAAVDAVLSGRGDDGRLLRGVVTAVRERRLLVWSRHVDEQRLLVAARVAGALPGGSAPFVGAVVNNSGGNKLDYYLERSLSYERLGCAAGSQRTRVTVRVHNTAPASGLPSYVTVRADRGSRARPGANGVDLAVYTSVGSALERATVDGRPTAVTSAVEREHPVWSVPLELPPGRATVVVLELRERPSDRAPEVLEQPLVRPAQVRVAGAGCDQM